MKTIYALVEPGTEKVRYIGQSKDAQKRFLGHINDARCRSKNYPVNQWVRKLIKNGRLPKLVIIEENPADINIAEVRWISHYRARVKNLLNVANGGNHVPVSFEQRVSNGVSGSASRLNNHAANPKAKKIWKLKHMMGVKRAAAIKYKEFYLAYHCKFRMKILAAQFPEHYGDWSML